MVSHIGECTRILKFLKTMLDTSPKATPIRIDTKANNKKLPIIENGSTLFVLPSASGLNNY